MLQLLLQLITHTHIKILTSAFTHELQRKDKLTKFTFEYLRNKILMYYNINNTGAYYMELPTRL